MGTGGAHGAGGSAGRKSSKQGRGGHHEAGGRGRNLAHSSQKLVADLPQKLGELTVDLDYLKKSLGNWDYEPERCS